MASWNTCERKPTNTGCPVYNMDDGRHFTDYRPICHLNNLITVNNNLKNSFEYRMHLTKNAEKLMRELKQLKMQVQLFELCNESVEEVEIMFSFFLKKRI